MRQYKIKYFIKKIEHFCILYAKSDVHAIKKFKSLFNVNETSIIEVKLVNEK